MTVHNASNLKTLIYDQSLKKNAAVAFIFCEDNTLIPETVKFFRKRSFDRIFLFITEPEQYFQARDVINIRYKFQSRRSLWNTIRLAIPALEDKWLYWGLNGEFFYYPFCENRNIHDLTDFLIGERRLNISGAVIDLYTGDIKAHSDGISMSHTYFDRVNYYAYTAEKDHDYLQSTIDEEELARIRMIYGGLKWRFGEYVPRKHRRIDRVPFFYVDDELNFTSEGFTDRPEFYTYRCEHHHNPTCAVMSFHMARYFRHNVDTRAHIHDFMWDGAQRFRWNSAQLLRMGIIETGQWF